MKEKEGKKSKKRKETMTSTIANTPECSTSTPVVPSEEDPPEKKKPSPKKAKKDASHETKHEKTKRQAGVLAALLSKDDDGTEKVELNEAVADLFKVIDDNKEDKKDKKGKKEETTKKTTTKNKKQNNKENEEHTQPGKAGKAPKSKIKEENRVVKQEKRGVVYVGHVPLGFFESQMRTFFQQFGKITRIRLARNRKTGHSKGYGWIEFELEEIADIVAKTMNGHMIENRCLVVKREEDEKVHPALFKGWNQHKHATRNSLRRKAIDRHNKDASKVPEGVIIQSGKNIISKKQVRRQTKTKAKAKSRLLAKGIDYDPEMK